MSVVPAPAPPGNTIVAPPATGTPFPLLILAAVIVAGGIWTVDQFDSRAAWLLSFLVLLGVAFRYRALGDQITGLFGGVPSNQQTVAPSASAPAAPTIVGPTGPLDNPIVEPGNIGAVLA